MLTVTLAIALLVLSGCTKQGQLSPPEPEPLSTAEVVAKMNPSVVRIVTADGTGSGIILDTDGHVLTNNHVIEKAASANVVLSDGRTLSAQILNRDWSIDLAVLKVTASDLQPATLGSSSEVQLGEDVITLGYPLDLGSSVTVTKGIISAFREPYVQTDAPVNPGNSGGPLVNMWGKVIGLVTAKPQTQGREPTEGIGFAIAVDQIKDVLTSLLSPQELSSLVAHGTVTDAEASRWYLSTVDASDNIHQVWGEQLWSGPPDATPKLMYSVRSKVGRWTSPEIIAQGSPRLSDGGYINPYIDPKGIIVDGEGTLHVVWIRNYGGPIGGTETFYASRPLGQPWSAAISLSNGRIFSTASLAMDSAYTLHLVCPESHCSFGRELGIYYLSKPKHGTWSQPSLIGGTRSSESDCPQPSTLGCDSQGNLHLAYNQLVHSSSIRTGPLYTRKPAGATWTLPTLVAQADGLLSPLSAFVGGDEVFLAGTGEDGRIAYYALLPDQSWSATQYLSGADHRSTNLRFARDASGTIYAAWLRSRNPEDTDRGSLILRWKAPGESWSDEQLVYEGAFGIESYSFVVDSALNLHFLISEHETPSCPEQSTYHEFYLTLALGQVVN